MFFLFRANTLYMYNQRYDALPIKYWILNQGHVDILNLDTGEEVLEKPNVLDTDSTLEYGEDLTLDSRIFSSEFNHESFCQKPMNILDPRLKDSNQLIIELPNRCSLMLCFHCEEEAVRFHEKILIAKKFQVPISIRYIKLSWILIKTFNFRNYN